MGDITLPRTGEEELPARQGFFSTIRIFRPFPAALKAQKSPAGPPPITTSEYFPILIKAD
jgi:hypothetical protein